MEQYDTIIRCEKCAYSDKCMLLKSCKSFMPILGSNFVAIVKNLSAKYVAEEEPSLINY